ncbi:hypothetical protein FMM54_07930 [Campylobacter sp. LR185c]|uniref:DUF5675 family protein n=1 Tax=Campylobacter sp. LR185c TaxID=2014525 RepID=UPI0012383CD7|nr:DUF5675 family protein [Campylobacter sp. LR185c]KAA6224632.1 hypothetical protein FMM54_07930 [Campylobacter sp. LR185c]KAA8603881.1 hypothetical protein CGP82_05675 [Campylobacter sp. LR185c]
MRITLQRRYMGKTCCQGKLKIMDDENNIIFHCLSLEEDEEGLESGKDLRVPPGIYKLKRHEKSKFEAVLRSITNNSEDCMINIYNENVSFERHILIHWGNNHKDTLGCILLGFSKIDNETIGQSRPACKEFYNLLRDKDLEKIEFEIINEF